jgi:hypothetical protein
VFKSQSFANYVLLMEISMYYKTAFNKGLNDLTITWDISELTSTVYSED